MSYTKELVQNKPQNDNTINEKNGERIAKYLSHAGVCSRREAERLIEEGKVKINGKKISSPATFVNNQDIIQVNGKIVEEPDRVRLWLYHKSDGLITTHFDPEGRRTVFEVLPEKMPRVISVGRLDLTSEGLLLLTNNGEFARKLEHPSTGLRRRYRVRVHGHVTQDMLDEMREGLIIDRVHYAPINAEIDKFQKSNCWLTMTLKEGKNREIRKIMEHFGLQVTRLIRINYGPFELGTLPLNQVKEIPYAQLKKLDLV